MKDLAAITRGEGQRKHHQDGFQSKMVHKMAQFHLLNQTRQSTEYSCGASALRSVLSYWGKDVDEGELMGLLGTNAEVGTFPEDIARGARGLGFDVELRENLTLDEVLGIRYHL